VQFVLGAATHLLASCPAGMDFSQLGGMGGMGGMGGLGGMMGGMGGMG
jgi:hypothetical protein